MTPCRLWHCVTPLLPSIPTSPAPSQRKRCFFPCIKLRCTATLQPQQLELPPAHIRKGAAHVSSLMNNHNHLYLPGYLVLVVGVLHHRVVAAQHHLCSGWKFSWKWKMVDLSFLKKTSIWVKKYEITYVIVNSPKSIHIYLVFRQYNIQNMLLTRT